jgi:hypothetical protein
VTWKSSVVDDYVLMLEIQLNNIKNPVPASQKTHWTSGLNINRLILFTEITLVQFKHYSPVALQHNSGLGRLIVEAASSHTFRK